MLAGLVGPAAFTEQDAQVDVCADILGVEFQTALKMRDRFVSFSELSQGQPCLVVRQDAVRAVLEDDLVRRRLMTVNMRFYATKQYLDKFGTPQTFQELSGHRMLSHNLTARQVNESVKWLKPLLSADHKSHMTINNYVGVLQATINHVGIGAMPDYVSRKFPELIRVLSDEESQEIPVFLAYPEELRHSKRVQAFRDFIVDEIRSYRKSYDNNP